MEWLGQVDELLGYQPNELPRTWEGYTNLFHSEDRDRVLAAIEKRLKSEEPYSVECRVQRKDGTYLYWQDRGTVVRDESGKPVKWLGAVSDITERKRAEEALQDSEEKYRTLVENAAEAIVIVQDGMMKFVNRMASEIIGYSKQELLSMSFIEFIHQDDRAMVGERYLRRLKGDVSIPKYAFRSMHKDGSFKWVEINAVLVTWEGKPATLNFLADITERKQAEETLRDSREELYRLLNSITEGAYGVDTNGNCTFVNRAFLQILGYQNDHEVLGKHIHELIHHSHYDGSPYPSSECRMYRVHQANQPINVTDEVFWRKNGVAIPVEYWSRPIVKDGVVIGSIATFIDITERKRAQEALEAERGLMRTLIDNLPDNVFIKDTRGGIILDNLAHRRLLGRRELDDVVGKSDRDFFAPALADQYMDDERRIVESGQPLINYEEPTVDQEGRPHWYLTTKVPVRDRHGNITALVGINRDITERKRAEEDLKESENKYRLLAENAQDVIFVLDMNLKYTYVSPSVKILRGYEPEEVLKQTSFEILTPSSRDLAMRTLSEIMELEKSERRDISISRTLELEMGRKDGSTVWTEVRFSFIRDENQRPVGILGVTRDITQRKGEIERVRKALGATVQAIAMTVETRDPYTAGHQRRVADLACAIAMEMNLPIDMIAGIRMAAAIHDLGKISVPAEMLSKPTKLTDLEFMIIKTHSQSGYDILKDIEFPWPVARIVVEHHERMNGSGYPNGLAGDKLLMESRILSVADVVEAMASHRPYRSSLGLDAALNEISKNKGILYEPEVVDACLRLFHDKDYKIID